MVEIVKVRLMIEPHNPRPSEMNPDSVTAPRKYNPNELPYATMMPSRAKHRVYRPQQERS